MLCLTWAHFIPNTAFTMKLTRWIVDQLAFVEHLSIYSLPEVARLTSGWFFSPSRTSYCSHAYARGQWTAWISLSRWSALGFFWLIWRGISRSYWQFWSQYCLHGSLLLLWTEINFWPWQTAVDSFSNVTYGHWLLFGIYQVFIIYRFVYSMQHNFGGSFSVVSGAWQQRGGCGGQLEKLRAFAVTEWL